MRAALIALVVVALVGAAASESAAKRKRPCRGGGTTYLKNRSFRVYEAGKDNHRLVGCRYKDGRRVTLASWYDCACSTGDQSRPRIWNANGEYGGNRGEAGALRGRYVAVEEDNSSGSPGSRKVAYTLRLFDLAKLRKLATVEGGAEDLVLKENGSLVYVGGAGLTPAPGGPVFAGGAGLIKIEARGTRSTPLDPAGAHPGSLGVSVDGKRIYWRTKGQPDGPVFSAPFD